MSWFGRKSVSGESGEVGKDENGNGVPTIKFSDVDMSGGKKSSE
jgi:hypothetical protein